MSATPRVSVQQIKEALMATRGNVQATADRLGLTRNSLYDRIQREYIDVDALRRHEMRGAAIRVGAAQADAIRQARRRLSVALGADVNDSALLDEFITEAFESWIAAKIAAAEAR